MNLDRLRIREGADGTPAAGTSRLLLAAAVILGLVLGYVLGAWRPWGGSGGAPIRVSTVVAGATDAASQAGFSAGGWIEVPFPDYPIAVCARAAQRLETMAVRPGDRVQAGQVLATIYDADARARLALAEARRQRALASADLHRAGARSEDRRVAEARAADQRTRYELARAAWARSAQLPPGALSPQALDEERAAYLSASQLLAVAVAECDKARAGFRREEVAMAEAEVVQAEAELALARQELAYTTVTAPASGGPWRALDVRHHPGDWVGPGPSATLVTLFDPTNLNVRLDVAQGQISQVQPGGRVVVRTEAHPRREYHGRVARIEPLAELAKNTLTVRVALEDPDDRLFPEMVAHATFLPAATAATPAARGLVVPAGAVGGSGADTHVYVAESGIARRRPVTVGERVGQGVVIGSGLQSGQRVIVSNLDQLADGTRVTTE